MLQLRSSGVKDMAKSLKIHLSQALVSARACNPSYSGGKDQKDCGLKPAQANSSARPYLKKPFTKNRTGGGPEFKPQYCKKQTNKKIKIDRVFDFHLT
jgi:hypothetical protein